MRRGGFVADPKAGEGAAGAVDFTFLEGFAAGDRKVVSEVLALFVGQAQRLSPSLDGAAPGWRDVVHTLKGSARGIGAHALGEACARAEAEGEGGLPAVCAALDAAVADIAAYRGRTEG
jgi:HPt (histidine-containing phosphotransfer) domain-containing protein